MTEDSSPPSTLRPYYAALERLVTGVSLIVPRGSKITLNSVALEAGKTQGSIKKSRSIYSKLIEEIKIVSKQQHEQKAPGNLRIQRAKQEIVKAKAHADGFEEKYKAALARELMLLKALDEAERRLRRVENVVPLMPKQPI